MSKLEDIGHSVLIVSAAERFEAMVRQSLKGFLMVDASRSVAMARRLVMERYYDIVIMNMPLPDETGEQFALDITRECKASILLVVPSEIYGDVLEHVTDLGILVISKPVPRSMIDKGVRFLVAVQNRIHELEKQVAAAKEKTEELRIVDKAKFLLVEKKHMSEEEAHKMIGKQAMDNGVSRKRIAEKIIDDFD